MNSVAICKAGRKEGLGAASLRFTLRPTSSSASSESFHSVKPHANQLLRVPTVDIVYSTTDYIQ